MHSIYFMLAAAGIAASSPAALFAGGDFTAAKAAYAVAVAQNPRDADALLGLARVELYENDVDGATKDLNAVLDLRPADPVAIKLLGVARGRQAVFASAKTLDVPAEGVVLPFVRTQPLPAIELRIDGRPATMLIDTGADFALDAGFAKRLGLTLTPMGGTFYGLGGRSAQVMQTTVPSVEAGPISMRDVKASIVPASAPSDPSIDGIVGTAFLSRFRSTIDYPNARLVLQPRDAPVALGAGAVSVPMWLVGDHMIFARGSVNGVANQLFSVDTGGPGIGFMPVDATIASARIRTFPEKAFHAAGAGGDVTVVPTVTGEVCVATACQKDVPGGYTPGGSMLAMLPFATSGSISDLFLRNYAVTLDFAKMQLVLSSGR